MGLALRGTRPVTRGIERSTCLCTSFPNMPAKVCCLTPIQLSAYVRRGELPNCFNCNPEFNPDGPSAGHSHRSYKEVERLVGPDDGSGAAVWIGGRFMAFIQGPKRWRPKNGSLQLVPGVVGGRNSGSISEHSLSQGHGFHYPIPSAGGRERNTSAYAVNHIPAESRVACVVS